MNFGMRIYVKTASFAALFALALFCGAGPSYAGPGQDSKRDAANSKNHPCRGNQECGEKWMTGDFHNHTTYTDGSWPMNDLIGPTTITPFAVPDTTGLYKQGTAPTGFRNALDFFTNSEHGGIRERDGFGIFWNNTTIYPTLPAIGDPTNGRMWRWQSLIRTSDIPNYTGLAYMGAYDWIESIRANYPEKIVMTGMEWNVPGHEHGSTGIVSQNARPIAEFEYRFDGADADGTTTQVTADTMGWPGKIQIGAYTSPTYPDYSTVLGLNARHNKTIDGVKWMQANYPTSGYIVPAHVERAGCAIWNPTTGKWDNGASGSNTSSNIGYSIAAFRDMNDNGPTVAFGFEGLPGHDKSSNRGEFSSSACGGGTYGGAGIYIAKVGGLWDNMLADGRRFFNFDSSDFHDDGLTGSDYWPGEYEKTYVKVKDGNGDGVYTQEDVINGLRSGNSFSVHGDLISELDFRVFPGASFKNQSGTNSATMGETLTVEKGDKITVQIRFKSPLQNNCKPGTNASASYVCALPIVNHVQLIQGRVNPTKAAKIVNGNPNPDFNRIDDQVASIVATFDASSWNTDAEGFTTMTFTVRNLENGMFFRIRGTNLGFNVANKTAGGQVVYGTDADGSPLLNTPGFNGVDTPWDDLWFYSNPIFVQVM